ASWNPGDDAVLEPVFPHERLRPLPRDVDVHIDAAADEVVEQHARRLVLPRLELRAQPVGQRAEAVMDLTPGGGLTDLHRDDTRRTIRPRLQNEAVYFPDLVPFGIEDLL